MRDNKEYSPTLYQQEKALGIRRSNGGQPLKRLRARHVAVLQLHLAGQSGQQIQDQTGYTQAYISLILGDPLSKDYIAAQLSAVDNEFRALYGNAVGAVRDGLRPSAALGTRLKAADMFMRAHGKYAEANASTETAEDVIQRMLQVNVQVAVGTESQPSQPSDHGAAIPQLVEDQGGQNGRNSSDF